MTSPGAEPGSADAPAPEAPPVAQGHAPAAAPAAGGLLPEQSSEDTDAAWGDYRERDDDRLARDRPPHWADF